MKNLKFCRGLIFLVLFAVLLVSVRGFCQEPEPYNFVLKWGGTGRGPGEFGQGYFSSSIFGIAIDSNDNVYVVDTWNDRVQKFDKNGNYILQWGSQGSEHGNFIFPCGIAIDKNDHVYVSERSGPSPFDGRIQKFDSQGNFLEAWDDIGCCLGIDIAESGNIYLLTYGQPVINKYGPSMIYLDGNGYCGHPTNDVDPLNFVYPEDIAVNSKGEIFVSVWGEAYCGLPYGHPPLEDPSIFDYHGQIKKFDSSLQYVKRWYLDGVTAMAIDSEDYILACAYGGWDMGVYKYDSSGNLVQQVAPNATQENPYEDGKIRNPISIAIDSEGNVYVGDLLNRIQKFAPPLRYNFEGFFNPIENTPIVNKANAGQTIPVKWRLTDGNGLPVSDEASFRSITSYSVSCQNFEEALTDDIEEYTAGSSGLQYLGDGYWQFNWKTSKAYAGQCRIMKLTLDDNSVHTASFKFK